MILDIKPNITVDNIAAFEKSFAWLKPHAQREHIRVYGNELVVAAIKHGSRKVLGFILSQGTRLDSWHLDLAKSYKRVRMVEFILKKGVVSDTVVIAAVKHGSLRLVQHLVKSGENVNATDCDGKTAMMHCFSGKDVVSTRKLQYLLENTFAYQTRMGRLFSLE